MARGTTKSTASGRTAGVKKATATKKSGTTATKKSGSTAAKKRGTTAVKNTSATTRGSAAMTTSAPLTGAVGDNKWAICCKQMSVTLQAEVRAVMLQCGGPLLWAGVPDFTNRVIPPMMVEQALQLVATHHGNQIDKGGNLYINHPKYVANLFGNRPSYQLIALMHDLLEDTDVTLQMLMSYPPEVVTAIVALTCGKQEDYDTYLDRLCDPTRTPRYVLYVKLADMYHNLDASRLRKFTETEVKRFEKYKRALQKIRTALGC